MELQAIWEEYGLDKLEEGMQTLFPQNNFSLGIMFQKLLEGEVLGAVKYLFTSLVSGMSLQLGAIKNIFIWLMVLGIVSALLTHFARVFEKHRIADLSFYYIYLLLSTVLLKSFSQVVVIGESAIEEIILFVKLLVPAYLCVVGIATGATTAVAYSQLLVLVVYGVEKILLGWVIPMIYGFIILSVINSIWAEEKLGMIIELVEKGIGWILKASMGVVTGINLFQGMITPMVDAVKKSTLQKVISAVPGVGNAADAVTELAAGSALVIKNSVGVVLLLLLLLLGAVPLLKIFLTALLFKGAAALMGVVSDKRISGCTNRTGDGVMLLLRTTGTAMLLFMITLAVVAMSIGRT